MQEKPLCPSCQTASVEVGGPGQAYCTWCHARFMPFAEAAGPLAEVGLDPATLRDLVLHQSRQVLACPTSGTRLFTIDVRGVSLHVSSAHQAVWLEANALERLRNPQAAAPAPAPFPSPSPAPAQPSFEQPSPPAYGQPPPAYGQPPPAYGQAPPAYGQPPPAYGQPPPAYGQPPPAYGQPPPAYGQNPYGGAPGSEAYPAGDAFGTPGDGGDFPPPGVPYKESRFAFSFVSVGGLLKLGGAAFVAFSIWYVYSSIVGEMEWPTYQIDWGYTVEMPKSPKPELTSRGFSTGNYDVLETKNKGGSRFVVVWGQAESAEAAEYAVQAVAFEMLGRNLVVGKERYTLGPVHWFEAEMRNAPPFNFATTARLHWDDNGHFVLTSAIADTLFYTQTAPAMRFVRSLKPPGG